MTRSIASVARRDERRKLVTMRRTLGTLLLLAALPGCHLAHERRVVDADAGPRAIDAAARDAGPRCTFSAVRAGNEVSCAISVGSPEACAEAALCLCGADPQNDSPSERLACASWELIARGAITYADFCTSTAPGRLNMSEVLEQYVGADPSSELQISPVCDQVPGLLGTRPYVDCGSIASELCRCDPHCDLDRSLGRTCLDMPPEQVACIAGRMWTSEDVCAFFPMLPTLATHCE